MKKNSKKYLVFCTSEEQFAISIDKIIMIEKVDYNADSVSDIRIRKVKSYPDYIEGVILHKNQVLPVIELEYLLTKNSIIRHDENKIIFIRGKEQDYSVLVNDVKSIIELNPDTFKKTFKESVLYLTEKEGEIYVVLDTEEILGIEDFSQVFRDFDLIKSNFNSDSRKEKSN